MKRRALETEVPAAKTAGARARLGPVAPEVLKLANHTTFVLAPHRISSSIDGGFERIWVLREKRLARTFYEQIGGTLLGERIEDLSGASVVEVAWGWRDLATLAS